MYTSPYATYLHPHIAISMRLNWRVLSGGRELKRNSLPQELLHKLHSGDQGMKLISMLKKQSKMML